LLRVLHSGKWGRLQGDQVDKFEQSFARQHGCSHGVAVVNGTVSLRLILMAAGIQAEDEVIVPPYTFLSTATAVVEANAVPVFADIDLNTFNLDPRAAETAITPDAGHHPRSLRGTTGRHDGIREIGAAAQADPD